VCLLRKEHSTIGETLSLDSFIAAKHILVSSPFSGHRPVEDILRQRGVSRKVALQIPHFSIIPQPVANSDLLVTLPATVGRHFESSGSLRTLEIPIDIPHFEVRMFWHEHQEEKASQRWLRDMIYDALSGLQ
jgi:DNA-binding transcriptional LysR family regulator